jgi:glycosyltransferase involved in cell wall biosynthesis
VFSDRASVSVAMATYQGERWIGEQVRSILAQTHPVDELIVADDGSTDRTTDLVRELVAAHPAPPRLVVLDGEGGLGVVANIQRALRAAEGDVVLLSDQDDVWHDDRVAGALTALDAPGALLTHSDARLVDGDGADLGATAFGRLELSETDLAGEARPGGAWTLLLRRNVVTGAATGLRRELLERALPVPDGWLHDEWLAIVAAAVDGVVPDRSVLVDYRQHGANQVGVAAPTIRRKLSRLGGGRRDRDARLLRRARSLAARLPSVDGVPAERLRDAARKLAHEERRSALPALRLARVPGVLRGIAAGDYGRFGGGARDVLRDLVQPLDAGTPDGSAA